MSSQRPMVVIDQFPWNELEGANDKSCLIKDPYWRGVELNLHQTIYKWNVCPVDMVVEPYITIPLSAQCSRFGLHHDEESLALDKDTTARSQHYSRTLKTMDDLEKIKDMKVSYDRDLSDRHMDEAREIFSGTAPLKQGHGIQFHLGIWDDLSRFIGMEDVYYEILDNPDFLHACMDRLTNSAIAGIREANALQLHNDIANSWAFGMAQLFTSVSPAATEEFETQYIKRMAREFGMIYYGCCEREDDLKETRDLAKANGVNLEYILKDVSTVKYDPTRLTKWADIAIRVAEEW